MSEFVGTLASAESLWKQGDHDGAWLALEELPPIERVTPEVVDLLLRICTNLCKWDMGDNLESVLRYAGEDAERFRITCAEYNHARARALCDEGDIEGAKERVKLACEQWPPIRGEALDDATLEGVW